MLESIEIRNFKKIRDEFDEKGNLVKERPLVLKDLKQVNYLVGENGSGKSSVLEVIKMGNFLNPKILYNSFGDLSKIFTNLTKFIFSFTHSETHTQTYKYMFDQVSNESINSSFQVGVQPLRIGTQIFFDCKLFSTFTQDVTSRAAYNIGLYDEIIKFNLDSITDTEVNKLKGFLNKYYYTSGFKVRSIYKSLENNPVIQIELENKINNQTRIENIKSLASGYKSLLSIYFTIQKNINGTDPQVICLEEPETSFHPDFQKKLPQIFQDISDEHGGKIQFIISTHSPFIINAASKIEVQKVYLIKGGQTIGKDGYIGGGQSGYSGNECINVVNEMLGSTFQDYGAPENVIIVEEASKKDFLDTLFNRSEFSKNISVIQSCFSGDGDLPNYEDKIRETLNINFFFKQNIVFSDKYIVFCDYFNEYYDENNEIWQKKSKEDGGNKHNKAMNMKIALGDRFVAESEELERLYPQELLTNHYPDWDKAVAFGKFLKNKGIENRGKVKCELAKQIASEITMEQFKKSFGKLHKLLFAE